MSDSLTDFLSKAGAVAMLGVAAAVIQYFFGWLGAARASPRSGEEAIISPKSSLGKMGGIIFYITVGVVAVVVAMYLYAFAMYTFYFLAIPLVLVGGALGLCIHFVSSVKKLFKR